MKTYLHSQSAFQLMSLLFISSLILSCSNIVHPNKDENYNKIYELNSKIRSEKVVAGAEYKPQYDLSKYNITNSDLYFSQSKIEGCLQSLENTLNIHNTLIAPWRSRSYKQILLYEYIDTRNGIDYHVDIYIYYFNDKESCSMGMENDLFESVAWGFRRIEKCLFDFCFTTNPPVMDNSRSFLWSNIYGQVYVDSEALMPPPPIPDSSIKVQGPVLGNGQIGPIPALEMPSDKKSNQDEIRDFTDYYFNSFQKTFYECMLD